MSGMGIRGGQIRDDTITGEEINEDTLVLTYPFNAKYTATSSSALVYIKWRTMGSNTSPGVNNKFIAPADGVLKSVLVRSTGTPLSTGISLHKAPNGTANLLTAPVETITVNMDTANTVVEAVFTGAASFSANEIIGISVNPTDYHGNVDLTILIELTGL